VETRFSAEQLLDPATRASEHELRRCVHCGFCTATCPTYVLLGDELDSPRGRIYLIKEMLEQGRAPDAGVVQHLDRCLSCLACMTTCPSGVNYMHLIDHARSYVATHYHRPWRERALRAALAHVLPYRERMRFLVRLAWLGKGLLAPLTRAAGWRSLEAMLALLPRPTRSASDPGRDAGRAKTARVAVLKGCAEPALAPQIRAATVRVLERMDIEVVSIAREHCCGALVHHLGREAQALQQARHNIGRWMSEIETHGLDAIVATAAGCGTMLENYGFLFAADPAHAAAAERISRLTCDVSELIAARGLPACTRVPPLRVAYQSACSLQHGQGVRREPPDLLTRAGFKVLEPAEAHLCCGSAGTYNLLQPQLAGQLRERKIKHLEALEPDVIASGNIGCIMQLRAATRVPVLHTLELLDWATGGPVPDLLADRFA
jgi:glycolate oxidase iron-sulfur subunit